MNDTIIAYIFLEINFKIINWLVENQQIYIVNQTFNGISVIFSSVSFASIWPMSVKHIDSLSQDYGKSFANALELRIRQPCANLMVMGYDIPALSHWYLETSRWYCAEFRPGRESVFCLSHNVNNLSQFSIRSSPDMNHEYTEGVEHNS